MLLVASCSFHGVKFYISGANMPGEGELKCIDWVKHMCEVGTEESVVIVGGDADLILQGLALSQVGNSLFQLELIWVWVWYIVSDIHDGEPG